MFSPEDLLNFSQSLATKCLFLNDEPCMARPTIIGLYPVELKYYPFLICLDECTEGCNVLSPKNVFQKKQMT